MNLYKEATMNKSTLGVAIAFLVVVCAGWSFSQQSVDSAIRERVRQYETAYNAGDAAAVAAIYAADGIHTYALGFTHRGQLEIANGLKDMFAGPFKGTKITLNPLNIRPISTDVAVEEASFSLSGLKDPSGTAIPPVTGLCLGVYRKQGQVWFAAAVQCMVPPPAPQKSRPF
jgi:uncharacterized protein (TIGR02246 family)